MLNFHSSNVVWYIYYCDFKVRHTNNRLQKLVQVIPYFIFHFIYFLVLMLFIPFSSDVCRILRKNGRNPDTQLWTRMVNELMWWSSVKLFLTALLLSPCVPFPLMSGHVNSPPHLQCILPFFVLTAFTSHCLSAGSAPCLEVVAVEAVVVEAAVQLPLHLFHLHYQSINLQTIAMEEKKC